MDVDHAQSENHLPAFVAGELGAEDAAALLEHVKSCTECQAVDHVLRLVRDVGLDYDLALFDAHPDPSELARFVLRDRALTTSELQRLARHARACPTCQHEATTVEAAARHADRWSQRLALVFSFRARLWIPAPAVWAGATAVVLLAGWVVLRGLQPTTDGVDSPFLGGPAPLIYLQTPTRAGVAVLTIRDAAPYHVVLVEWDRAPLEPSANTTIEIRDNASDDLVWSQSESWSTLFDADQRVLSLLVPTARLPDGTFRLDVQGPSATVGSYRFRVQRAP